MKSITMATCAKIGILSLFSFAYAMDKDSIGLNEDILAIASKGKYSDNMPHVRRLTASEKEKVLGGIRLTEWSGYTIRDRFGNLQIMRAYIKVDFDEYERGSGYARLGGKISKAIHAEFSMANRPQGGATLHFAFEHITGYDTTMRLIKYNPATKQEVGIWTGSNILQNVYKQFDNEAWRYYGHIRERLW